MSGFKVEVAKITRYISVLMFQLQAFGDQDNPQYGASGSGAISFSSPALGVRDCTYGVLSSLLIMRLEDDPLEIGEL